MKACSHEAPFKNHIIIDENDEKLSVRGNNHKNVV